MKISQVDALIAGVGAGANAFTITTAIDDPGVSSIVGAALVGTLYLLALMKIWLEMNEMAESIIKT